eukprot:5169693-Karenia_brevis.AAC.1
MAEFSAFHTAAIGALEKSDDSFRVIHDGTHGVQADLEIVTRDQVAYPTIAEKTFVLTRAASPKSTLFGLKADVSKAHRRCRIWQPDQKWQICRTRPGSVWVNTVGTLGIGSAGY